MGTDIHAFLDCSPAAAKKALAALQGGRPSSEDVLPLGKNGCVVATPHKWPPMKAGQKLLDPPAYDEATWREVTRWVADLAKRAGHRDARGVFVVPDETAVEVQLAARGYASALGLASGLWLRRGAAPVPTQPSEPPRKKIATLPKAPPRATLACFVVPQMPESLKTRFLAVVTERDSLADGAGLFVVREHFDDVEALLSVVVENPMFAQLATDPRGLLVIPGSAYEKAQALGSYEAVVARFRKPAAKQRGIYLKVADLDALRKALLSAKDEAWLRDMGEAGRVHLAEARAELRRGGG